MKNESISTYVRKHWVFFYFIPCSFRRHDTVTTARHVVTVITLSVQRAECCRMRKRHTKNHIPMVSCFESILSLTFGGF